MDIDKFICGDSLTIMKNMPDECVDLVVTSPPYNLLNSTSQSMKHKSPGKKSLWPLPKISSGYLDHGDCMPHEEYVSWQREVLSQIMRLIKPNGAIFYNHKWRVQNGLLQDRQDIVSGFPVRQIIIWKKNGGMNFNKKFFLPSYEVIYLICKPDFKLADEANLFGDVWEFNAESKNSHPAPFPIPLAERIIYSTDAKIVLDPFMGSGTTAIAAKKLGRNFIGIELSKEYIILSQKRLEDAMRNRRLF